jgi:hypothetical protein
MTPRSLVSGNQRSGAPFCHNLATSILKTDVIIHIRNISRTDSYSDVHSLQPGSTSASPEEAGDPWCTFKIEKTPPLHGKRINVEHSRDESVPVQKQHAPSFNGGVTCG